MFAISEVFQVIEEQIRMEPDLLKIFPRQASGRLHGSVNTQFTALSQYFFGKIWLHQGLPAGKGQAATGIAVKDRILLYFCYHFFGAHLQPYDLQGLGRAGFCAFAAAIAERPVYLRGVAVKGNGRTGLVALTACLATGTEKNGFRSRILGSGIGTPAAGHGASFQEDHSANTGAIVDAESLDIEDNVSRHKYHLIPIPGGFWDGAIGMPN